MKRKNMSRIVFSALGAIVLMLGAVGITTSAFAEGFGMTLSPMNQSIIVDPGSSRDVSFAISNPSSASMDVKYKITVEPFYISNNSDIYYEAEGDSAEMMNWVTFNVPTEGVLAPNEVKDISLTVDVPSSAPAGGQYIAVVMTLNDEEETVSGDTLSGEGSESGVNIKEVKRMAHLIYAEVTGDTIKTGEVVDANVPSFLFSGNIMGTSTVKNTGNVHGEAKYTLQVFPLFSDEEVYTNEEDPFTKKILPDRSYYNELAWEETPSIGIFNVVYTVDYEGSVTQVEKMVVICPLWLLFLIVFVIAVLIIWLVMRIRAHKKDTRATAKSE